MMMELDALIDINLRALENHIGRGVLWGTEFDFVGKENETLQQSKADQIYELMLSYELIEIKQGLIFITKYGLEILKQGGWVNYQRAQNKNQAAKEKDASLQRRLAISTIEANEINKKNATVNRKFMIANFVLAVANIVLLLFQLFSE